MTKKLDTVMVMRYNKVMSNHTIRLHKNRPYNFTVVLEPDEDEWFVYCPLLRSEGAVTCGRTPTEAIKNIQDVLEMIVEEFIVDGREIPENETDVEIKTVVSV
ncbi:type II toxin-antitoxin system HicB family antitoxin [Candidatus Magnetobacterium casense]|uniref:Type II toxin-antitoxin system HicB family antitoxin n=1 Tax=Candidatus Magnetobacterium casense TaxID=1455061 RepID=A0ABS6RZ16_9BACT|nr:type II toxin-antitoxin system HicB family antitoxin [Candidatus Magnetobacterium casensis]MBV6341662.1 type II toxin-antitoxin system HicB family antitoxin [Candidatus Magnetobacterium casensis]